MIRTALLAILLVAAAAAAQQEATEDAIKKQAAEISRLMRESERLLLELARVDRLVEAQKQVEEELKKLLPPEQAETEMAKADAEKREQLEQKQRELRRNLEEMLAGEKEKGALVAQQIEELLKNLPREQAPQGGGGGESKEQREKRMREREEEKKQHQQQQQQQQKPRDPKDQQRSGKKPKEPDPAQARLKRVEAWITRLPPEEQERINRNDFSRVPIRYRKLVEEYTAQRAKRAAESESESTDR